jgi:hypothetical protein
MEALFSGLMIALSDLSVWMRALLGFVSCGLLGACLFAGVPYLWSLPKGHQPAAAKSTGIMVEGGEDNHFILRGVHGFDQGMVLRNSSRNLIDSNGTISAGPPMSANTTTDADAQIPPVAQPELVQKTSAELKVLVSKWRVKAEAFDQARLENTMSTLPDMEKFRAGSSKLKEDFSLNLKAEGLGLRNELLRRLGQPLTQDLLMRTRPLDTTSLAGPHPATDIAALLVHLSNRLPS